MESTYEEMAKRFEELNMAVLAIIKTQSSHNFSQEDLKRIHGVPVSAKVQNNGYAQGVSCGAKGDTILVNIDGKRFVYFHEDDVQVQDFSKLPMIAMLNQRLL